MTGWKIGIAAAVSMALCGCIQTQMQGYADLQAPKEPVSDIAVLVSGPPNVVSDFQTAIDAEAARHGLRVEDLYAVLPPTRTYSDAEAKALLRQQGANAILVVSVGDSGVQRQYAGTFINGNWSGGTMGTATASQVGGWTNVRYQARSQGTFFATATPIYRPTRTTVFQARLVEVPSGRTLWTGGGQTNSGGLLFVGMNGSSAAGSIFNDLQQKGLVGPAK